MYQLRAPSPELAAYVEHYWFVTDDDGPVDLRVDVFVDTRADLVLNHGASYRRETIGGATVEIAASTLDAQRLSPIRIVQRGRVRVSGVRFRLGGLAPFTGASLAELSDRTPPPAEAFGAPAESLDEAVRRATDVDEGASLIDAFLREQFDRHGPHPVFESALARIVAAGGSIDAADMAEQSGMSLRHLERLFAHRLGFPPKTVARVVRFQRALGALMTDPGVPLAELASDCGYFDQAHFIREFRRFTGGVPRGYRGYYPPEGPRDFAPNVVAFVQDGAQRGSGD